MSGRPESAESLRRRIFNVVGAATWQMDQLLGLLDIVVDTGVPTAAVECSATPRLLINPDFVRRHCTNDEALFMLVLHELHHVVLGHTRLFDRPTLAHNIAFDAVINAMLCQQFRDHRYAQFFESINSPDRFPGRLLRPPLGWPDRMEFVPESSEGEKRALTLLYGTDSGGATYVEIFNLLVAECRVLDGSEAVLLGAHDSPTGDSQFDPLLKAVLAGIVGFWPRPPISLGGRDEGADVTTWHLPASVGPTPRLRSALRVLLRQAGVDAGQGRGPWQPQPLERSYVTETVHFQPRDRRVAAWRALHGTWPVMYRAESTAHRHSRVPHPEAHVYLDISGSMDAVMPALSGALAHPHREGRARLFGFSTVVDEVSARDLHRCQFQNTLGTDINCVLQHLVEHPPARRPRSVVLLTDGCVGAPRASLIEPLRAHGLRFFVGLTPDGHTADLEPLNATITTLPL